MYYALSLTTHQLAPPHHPLQIKPPFYASHNPAMSCQTLTMSCPTVEIIDLLDDLDLDIRGFADTDDESYYSYSEPSLLFKSDGGKPMTFPRATSTNSLFSQHTIQTSMMPTMSLCLP